MDLSTYNRHFMSAVKKGTKKRNITGICCKSSQKADRTVSQVWDDFVKNTTLLGIQHSLRTKSIFWIVAFLCCIALSVIQTWSTADEFFRKETHQTFGIESKMLMPFPSITICNNVVLPFKTVNSSFVENYIEIDSGKNYSHDKIEKLQHKNNEAVLSYVRSLQKKDKNRSAIPIDDWLVKCVYQYNDCNRSDSTLFYEFNHPLDGTCITFNPAFNNSGVKADIDTKLMFSIRRQINEFQIFSGRPRISVLIHPPGTTPVMDLAEAIDILGGQNVNLGLKLIQKDFMLKRKEPPSCVSDNAMGEKYKKRNFYYNSKTPYRFSIEACMKYCVQTLINEPCNILDGTFNILDESYEKGLKMRYPPFRVCNATAEVDVSMEICECPFPCKLLQYQVGLDTTDLQDQPEKNDNQKETNGHPHVQVNLMKVSIQFQTNIFDHITEELDYTTSSFLGIMGGNLSLWLGLCVLSLLEVAELIWNITSIKLKQIFSKLSSGKNDEHLPTKFQPFKKQNKVMFRSNKIRKMSFKDNPLRYINRLGRSNANNHYTQHWY